MKHFLWLFILIPLVCYGADSKITDLPDVGASSDDVMYVVDNPGLSTASDNKITLGNLLLFFATQDMTLTGTIDASGATVTWPATITTTTFVGALTGNADTATALADDPDSCASGFVTDFDADGTLTCGTSFTGTVSGGTASTVAVWDGSQNLTSLTSQNMVTTGYIDGAVNVTVSTSTPVTVSGSSNYYINGQDGAITFNLPAAAKGLAYCFANVLYAQALTIHPASGDYIVLAGENNDADNVVSLGAATDQICILGIDGTYWKVTASTGTWAND